MYSNSKKGFTIAELTVVIALISIIGVMVTTFSVVMYRRSESNREALEIINEVSSVKTVVESWLGEVGNSAEVVNENGLPFGLAFDGNSLIIKDEKLTYSINGEEKEEKVVPLAAIKSASFSRNGSLFYCTLTHSRGETTFVIYCNVVSSEGV